MTSKGHGKVFVWSVMALLAMPLVLMPIAGGSVDAEKSDGASLPSLVNEDGGLNVSFLSDAGAWFEDNFAFRGQMVDANSHFEADVFGTSPVDNVVVGNDGWLYYAGTLNDYQRRLSLSDREIDNIAYNLSLMQEAVENTGGRFLFVSPPNKNSLYPEHMPYYLLPGEGSSNLERLEPRLRDYGVYHVDLLDAFQNQSQTLYLQRDSHWNNDGALLAYTLMENGLGRQPRDFTVQGKEETDHTGDVESMLYPESAGTEQESLWPASEGYEYTNGATSVEDSLITTTSTAGDATGSLLMYRDSFGNALLPYFASSYADATFTKLVPYDMTGATLTSGQDVVVERTERHLQFFSSQPPYLEAPARTVNLTNERQGSTTAHVSVVGGFLMVEGDLDPAVAQDGQGIYLRISGSDGSNGTYEAFHVSPESANTADSEGESAQNTFVRTDCGYRAYVYDPRFSEADKVRVEVLVGSENAATKVCDTQCSIERSK